MTTRVTIFIAFAKEDEAKRNLFTGQRIHPRTPFEFTDMSVKVPYTSGWKDRVRARVRRSDGVIALVSRNTPAATGQLWEMKCAKAEKKPRLGIWIDDGYRVKPPEMGFAQYRTWRWSNVSNFIDRLM